jgi:diaminopimelate epimerase
MRMFNPDGSEAEMCGNGLRCVVKYAVEGGLARPRAGSIEVETLAGVMAAQTLGDGQTVERVRVSMGVPRFAPAEIPLLVEAQPPILDLRLEVAGQTLRLTCLSLGNPHAVHFLDGPVADFPLEQVGPLVEHHALFPQRVNFEVVHVAAPDRIEARVWERGAGPTLACGSGASAVVVAAHLHSLAEERVDITLPGGALSIEWDGRGEVYLTGPAERVFAGQWEKA